MTRPTTLLTRSDAILRARLAFWWGLTIGVLTGMAISAAALLGGAWFAAGGWM